MLDDYRAHCGARSWGKIHERAIRIRCFRFDKTVAI
jgi:hypothetical protein